MNVESILKKFPIGNPLGVKPLGSGLINTTYKVITERDIFVLQKLHPVFDERVVEDAWVISEHVLRKGVPTPRFIRTKDGELCYKEEGKFWRMMTYIEGRSFERVPEAKYAFQAGKLVGELHRALRDLDYKFKFIFEGFHDTPRILNELVLIAEGEKDKAKHEGVRENLDFLKETLPPLFLSSSLPQRIIHGDLKISNIMFSPKGKAVGIIDLDTLMHSTLPVELGDAFRSWCTVEEGGSEACFDTAIFEAGMRGYHSSGFKIQPEEKEYIVQGIKLITLELAARFLKDFFEDAYFNWDAKRYSSRAEHNLARTKRQIAIYKDICGKEDEIENIVKKTFACRG